MEEKKPDFVKKSKVIADDNYKKWLSDLKQRLQRSQIKAAVKVNTVMLEFYWNLGRDIVALKAEQTWGSGLVEQLSLDLKEAYPNQKGFSARNIWNAKRWYLFYNQDTTRDCLTSLDSSFLSKKIRDCLTSEVLPQSCTLNY